MASANENGAHRTRISQRAQGPATVLAIGTAVPPNVFEQSSYPDFYFNVTNCTDKVELKQKFQRICDRSAIRKRHFYVNEEILKENPGMCTYKEPSLDCRQDIAVREVPKLAKEAAVKAMKEWGQPKSKITHVVFGTTSGVDMPGADFQLAKLLGLRPNVKRVMLYQQGCFAGATLMRIAKDLAENNKGARVLVTCSEVTAVTFRAPSETHLDGLVGSALFGDGAAALIIGSDPVPEIEKPLFELHWSGESIVPESDGAILGHLREAGLVFHLLKDVPGLISKNVKNGVSHSCFPLTCRIRSRLHGAPGFCRSGGSKNGFPHSVLHHIEKILAEPLEYAGVTNYNDFFWAVHPGGPAILDQMESKLCMEKSKLGATREVLSNYGNMSSASVLFVLDEVRKRSVAQESSTTGEGSEWGILLGFGSGLTVETLLLKSVALSS